MLSPHVSQSCCEAQEGAQQRCGKRASHRPCSCSKQCIERLPPHTLYVTPSTAARPRGLAAVGPTQREHAAIQPWSSTSSA